MYHCIVIEKWQYIDTPKLCIIPPLLDNICHIKQIHVSTMLLDIALLSYFVVVYEIVVAYYINVCVMIAIISAAALELIKIIFFFLYASHLSGKINT